MPSPGSRAPTSGRTCLRDGDVSWIGGRRTWPVLAQRWWRYMADLTMEEMVAAVTDLGNLRDPKMCVQHIADSCLAWLTEGDQVDFAANLFLEVLRSRRYRESWEALHLMEDQLNISRLPRPPILELWSSERDSGVRKRPKTGSRRSIVRDIALVEVGQGLLLIWPDVFATRNDEKKGPHLSVCDAVAQRTGLTCGVVKAAWHDWGPNAKPDPHYDST